MSLNTAALLKSLESDKVELLGTVVILSLRMGVSTVSKSALIGKMKSNPDIPDAWIPEDFNPLSLYSNTVTSEASRSINKMIVNDPSFDVDTHARYFVHSVKRKSLEDVPFIHRAQHFIKDTTEIESGELRDISYGSKILISLHVEEDAAGDKNYTINVVPEVEKGNLQDINDIDVSNFAPLIDTISERFNDLLNGSYGAKQITQIIKKALSNCSADALQNSTYFLRGENSLKIQALGEVLNSINPAIKIMAIPVTLYKGDDPLLKAHTQVVTNQVNKSIEDSLMAELEKAIDALDALAEKDREAALDPDKSGVRASTWVKRLEEIEELERKIQDYRSNSLLVGDILGDLITEAKTKAEAGI